MIKNLQNTTCPSKSGLISSCIATTDCKLNAFLAFALNLLVKYTSPHLETYKFCFDNLFKNPALPLKASQTDTKYELFFSPENERRIHHDTLATFRKHSSDIN